MYVYLLLITYLTCLPCTLLTHIAHTYQLPSSPCASALDHHMVSALRFRVGWASDYNNKQTNEQMNEQTNE